MKREANYTTVEVNERENWILIEDLGPWDEFMTVTNAAEWVVADMFRRGDLVDGRRLFYIDSMGDKDEILIEGRRAVGFQPARSLP